MQRELRKAKPVWTTAASILMLFLALAAGRPARADQAAEHYNLGLQLKRDGKVVEAIAEVEKAIVARPNYAAAFLTLGNLWRTQGNYEKAVANYEKAVKLQPKDAIARGNLGAAYARLKRLDEGIREMEASVELSPKEYEVRVSLGFAYRQKGDYKNAIVHLTKATDLQPSEIEIRVAIVERRLLKRPGTIGRATTRPRESTWRVVALKDAESPVDADTGGIVRPLTRLPLTGNPRFTAGETFIGKVNCR